jgi:hypothetical protein
LAHHLTRRLAYRGWQDFIQGQDAGNQVEVRLDLGQQLRLGEQLLQIEPLEGVVLHNLRNRLREVTLDVAEPTGDIRGRISESTFITIQSVESFVNSLILLRESVLTLRFGFLFLFSVLPAELRYS